MEDEQMKKIYLKPQMNIVALKYHQLLSSSNFRMVVTVNDVPDAVIEYGGIDEDGDLDPE